MGASLGRNGRPAEPLEGGLVGVYVEPIDGLEGDLSGEVIGGSACYSRGAGYGRWDPHPPSRYGNCRPVDY